MQAANDGRHSQTRAVSQGVTPLIPRTSATRVARRSAARRGWYQTAAGLQEQEKSTVLAHHPLDLHVNKVHHVTTITRVANDQDEDWPWDVANEVKIEGGVIWVYGVGEDGVQGFTDFGNKDLIELVRKYKKRPGLLKRGPPE